MPPILSAQGLSKKYGVAPLFRNISFTVSEGDRIGVIGPNGSGKSTLLEILQGRVRPDSGEVAVRKGTRLECVLQISEFAEGETIRSVIDKALAEGRRVLVHCGAGSERAPLTVAWFLNRRRAMSLEEAYTLLKRKRPIVQDRRAWLRQYLGQ